MKLPFHDQARSFFTVAKQLKIKGVLTAFTSRAEFSQLIKPLGSRVLILSAHPGDDVMGMGGAMAWYAKLGVPMTILTLTAGRRGTNTGKYSKPLGPKRQKEALAAYKGLDETLMPHFWDLDEGFAVTEELVLQLLDLVDELNPDIIYTPSLMDSHPDSQATARLLYEVLGKLPSTRLKAIQVAQYELWTPLVPNKILNIDEQYIAKQKAIQCHETQLLCRNYEDAMLGLNRYRAAIMGAGAVAEAYFISSCEQYRAFVAQTPTPVLEMVK
jgi:LmbE family N-acetylglucosaminyl deacetylase